MINRGELGVYIIRNTRNGKMYVGSSLNTRRRMIDHKTLLNKKKHYNPHLQSAYNKEPDEFEFVHYQTTLTQEEAIAVEQQLIDNWNLILDGYNIAAIAKTRRPDSKDRVYVMTENHKLSLKGPRPAARGKKHHATKPIYIWDTITNTYLGCWKGGAMGLSRALGLEKSAVGHCIYMNYKTRSGLKLSYKQKKEVYCD